MKLIIVTPKLDDNTLSLGKKVNIFIHQDFSDENLSLKTISENYLFTSAEYLGRVYQKQMGTRFHTKLLEVRMENAKILLLKGNKVYEVANLVGFGENAEYFSSVFKKSTGMTPKQFVKSAH